MREIEVLKREIFKLKVDLQRREHSILAKAGYFRLICEKVGKCEKCGLKENLTVHHIVPRSEGGLNKEENFQVLCRDCHNKVHQNQDIL